METNMWYLDNKASNHMIEDLANFKELLEKFIRNMKFCKRSIVPIQDEGSILFQCKNGDQHLLTKVYYILSLKINIICHGQMTEEESRKELIDSFLKIFDKNRALLMKVKRSQSNLYEILTKDHQLLLKVSISIGDKKVKNKPKGWEKKERKNRAKKKP